MVEYNHIRHRAGSLKTLGGAYSPINDYSSLLPSAEVINEESESLELGAYAQWYLAYRRFRLLEAVLDKFAEGSGRQHSNQAMDLISAVVQRSAENYRAVIDVWLLKAASNWLGNHPCANSTCWCDRGRREPQRESSIEEFRTPPESHLSLNLSLHITLFTFVE